MDLHQRDLVFLYDDIHTKNSIQEHPYIVISCQDAILHDGFVIVVMTTSSGMYNDDYSFPLTNEMFVKPLDKENCQARMHIIISVKNSQIAKRSVNKMKLVHFKQLLKQIKQTTLSVDEEE